VRLCTIYFFWVAKGCLDLSAVFRQSWHCSKLLLVNHYMLTNNQLVIGVVFVVLINCFVSFNCLGVTISSSSVPLLTLEIHDLSLKDVVAAVSKKTGYIIKVDERLGTESISGKYIEVPIENFFYRILRNKNVSVISNDQEKILVVKILGSKPKKYYMIGAEKSNDSKSGLLTIRRFQKLQHKQAKDYQDYLANLDSTDPIMGLKLSFLRNTEESQARDYQKYLNNPDSVDSLTGLTLSEMGKTKEYQLGKYQKYLANPDSVDSLTGQSLSMLHKIRQRQLDEYKRHVDNYDTVDPVMGLSLSEINGNIKRQLKEYQEYLNNPDSVESMLNL